MTTWQDALFAPRRVAVVGASATPGKAGHLFLSNLAQSDAGFDGEIDRDPSFRNGSLGLPRLSEVSQRRPVPSISRSS